MKALRVIVSKLIWIQYKIKYWKPEIYRFVIWTARGTRDGTSYSNGFLLMLPFGTKIFFMNPLVEIPSPN